LRAKIVKDLQALKKYQWCGHSALMGKVEAGFQEARKHNPKTSQNFGQS